MIREGYNLAQVCINGHVINSMAITSPAHNKKFFDKCGGETVTNCQDFFGQIKGFIITSYSFYRNDL